MKIIASRHIRWYNELNKHSENSMMEIRAIAAPEDAGRTIKYFVRSNMRLSYQSY